MMNHSTLQPLLAKLGLNTTEQIIYLTGLTTGPATIIQLATHADLKRLTTHQAVMSMLDQGIFLQTYYGKKRLFYPNNYDGLRLLVEEKKFALRQLEYEVDASKTIFDAMTTAHGTQTNTRLYHGIEGLNTSLLEIAKDGEPVSIIYDANSLNTLIDTKLFHRSYAERTKRSVATRLIVPPDFTDYRHIERKEDYIVSIKVIDQSKLLQGGIEIWGSKVAMHCYRDGFISTTIIDNRQIANLLLVMYESMRTSATDYHEQFLMI